MEPQRSNAPPRLKPLRVAWYAATLASAVAAIFVDDPLFNAVGRGAVQRGWLLIPPALFSVLFAGYAIDRWSAVRRGAYPVGRALAQTTLGVVFASVLVSSTMSHLRDPRASGPHRLFAHPDAQVRLTAVYAQGFLGPVPGGLERVVARLDDRSPEVRAAAREVLSRWSGRDSGDEAGIRAWASASSRTSTLTGEGPR